MVRVEYDPENLTFTIYHNTGISGCEAEVWRFNPDKWLFEVETCLDAEPTTITVDPETGVNDLRDAASEAGLQAQLLLAAIKPELLDEYFIDVRFVIDPKGDLVAAELLPCMGSPGCNWLRVEGRTRTERLFLESLEELVPCNR